LIKSNCGGNPPGKNTDVRILFGALHPFFALKNKKIIKNPKNISKSFAICSILCYNEEDKREFFRNALPIWGEDCFF